MTTTTTGWVIFAGALGMMFSLVAVDIATLQAWESATSPLFVAKIMTSIGTVIAAFVGGKLIPTRG